MTGIAATAEIGICCDYATCFTNLTHFPKQDAQVVFIYLVTTLITLYNCALLWVSQHNRHGMKAPLNDCPSERVRAEDGGTLAYSPLSLGPLPYEVSEATFQSLTTIHFYLRCGLSHKEPTPAILSTGFHESCCHAWSSPPSQGESGAPLRSEMSSAYRLLYLMLYGDCLFNCFATEMSVSRGKAGTPAGQECMVFASQLQHGAQKGDSSQ